MGTDESNARHDRKLKEGLLTVFLGGLLWITMADTRRLKLESWKKTAVNCRRSVKFRRFNCQSQNSSEDLIRTWAPVVPSLKDKPSDYVRQIFYTTARSI